MSPNLFWLLMVFYSCRISELILNPYPKNNIHLYIFYIGLNLMWLFSLFKCIVTSNDICFRPWHKYTPVIIVFVWKILITCLHIYLCYVRCNLILLHSILATYNFDHLFTYSWQWKLRINCNTMVCTSKASYVWFNCWCLKSLSIMLLKSDLVTLFWHQAIQSFVWQQPSH